MYERYEGVVVIKMVNYYLYMLYIVGLFTSSSALLISSIVGSGSCMSSSVRCTLPRSILITIDKLLVITLVTYMLS